MLISAINTNIAKHTLQQVERGWVSEQNIHRTSDYLGDFSCISEWKNPEPRSTRRPSDVDRWSVSASQDFRQTSLCLVAGTRF